MNQSVQSGPTRLAVDIAIKLGLIFLIIAWCFQILVPFATFLLWGTVIAISTSSLFFKMRDRLGGKPAVILFAVLGLGVVLVPTWMFAGSLIDSAQSFNAAVEKGEFDIQPPAAGVKDWPLVGEQVFQAWTEASENFDAFLEDHSEQLQGAAKFFADRIKSIGLTVVMFVLATLIAAALLAHHEAAVAGLRRFARRLVGDQAEEMLQLSAATIRSVTVGVLGIAFIQAVLLGGGMLVVGVPAAGLISLVILVFVIAQLPALIVMAPVIAWVFSVESTTTALVFTVYSVLASMSDMVLKPIMLGRGVDAPMLVILLGAIGGMIMSGILGLFVGAVVLALGYKLYQAWLSQAEEPETGAAGSEG